MRVPHITKLLAELENIASANWKTWEIPNATAADFVTWAQSRARHTIAEVMGEIALAEQRQEQLLISADEARKLGAGNAEWRWECGKWAVINRLFPYFTEAQYRAIKQPDQTCTRSHPHELMSEQCKELTKIAKANYEKAYPPEPAEPHAELKAMYEQQVRNGTTEFYLWEFLYLKTNEWRVIPVDEPPLFINPVQYRCTPKPTCQIRNLNSGVTETMTREAAKLLQGELGDTVEWWLGSVNMSNWKTLDFNSTGLYTYKLKANIVKLDGELMSREAAIALWESKKDTCDIYHKSANNRTWWHVGRAPAFDTHDNEGSFGEYELRERPLKQVSWKDMPVGVMTNKGELRFVNPANNMACCERGEKSLNNWVIVEQLTLAPASEQHWIVRHGTNPKDIYALKGIDVTCKYVNSDLFLFKVTGIAEGWELK